MVITSLCGKLDLQDLSLTVIRAPSPASGQDALVVPLTVTAKGSAKTDWDNSLVKRATLVVGDRAYRPKPGLSRRESSETGPLAAGASEVRSIVFTLPASALDAVESPGSFLQVISTGEIAAGHDASTAATIGRPTLAVTAPQTVLLGLPCCNGSRHLGQALDSLLAQRDGDFMLTVVDDCSEDDSFNVARSYARDDPRVVVERNSRRLGLVGNWRRVFSRSQRLQGPSDYFAWVSDHDVWEPDWLGALRSTLDADSSIVGAYPRAVQISGDGRQAQVPAGRDARGGNRWLRMAVAHHRVPVGYAIYGLFRTSALVRCGLYRPVVFPDRLLVSQLAVLGELHEVREVLWQRRMFPRGGNEVARQRAVIFPDRPPLVSMLPWWLAHPLHLADQWGVRGRGAPDVSRSAGIGTALVYLVLGLAYAGRRARALHPSGLARPLPPVIASGAAGRVWRARPGR